MRRTLYCGSLREQHAGQYVVLEGWVNRRRDLGGLLFIDLRDREGIVQVVVDPENPCLAEANRVRAEWVVRIEGGVRLRPPDQHRQWRRACRCRGP